MAALAIAKKSIYSGIEMFGSKRYELRLGLAKELKESRPCVTSQTRRKHNCGFDCRRCTNSNIVGNTNALEDELESWLLQHYGDDRGRVQDQHVSERTRSLSGRSRESVLPLP